MINLHYFGLCTWIVIYSVSNTLLNTYFVLFRWYMLWKCSNFSLFCIRDKHEHGKKKQNSTHEDITACSAHWISHSQCVFRLQISLTKWILTYFSLYATVFWWRFHVFHSASVTILKILQEPVSDFENRQMILLTWILKFCSLEILPTFVDWRLADFSGLSLHLLSVTLKFSFLTWKFRTLLIFFFLYLFRFLILLHVNILISLLPSDDIGTSNLNSICWRGGT